MLNGFVRKMNESSKLDEKSLSSMIDDSWIDSDIIFPSTPVELNWVPSSGSESVDEAVLLVRSLNGMVHITVLG